MNKIALATGNKGKLAEFSRYLETLKIEMFQGPKITNYPPEDGRDYRTNALLKARHGAKEWKVPCVGEDSGIEIAGLGNLPGHLSARFSSFSETDILRAVTRKAYLDDCTPGASPSSADQANNDLILKLLKGKDGDDRLCRYVACLALVAPNGDVLYINQSSVEGRVLKAPQGKGGFGFDPIVEFLDYPGKSVAELSMDEKNLVSHRGQVIQNLMGWLARKYA